jgi:hypothetical protein
VSYVIPEFLVIEVLEVNNESVLIRVKWNLFFDEGEVEDYFPIMRIHPEVK